MALGTAVLLLLGWALGLLSAALAAYKLVLRAPADPHYVLVPSGTRAAADKAAKADEQRGDSSTPSAAPSAAGTHTGGDVADGKGGESAVDSDGKAASQGSEENGGKEEKKEDDGGSSDGEQPLDELVSSFEDSWQAARRARRWGKEVASAVGELSAAEAAYAKAIGRVASSVGHRCSDLEAGDVRLWWQALLSALEKRGRVHSEFAAFLTADVSTHVSSLLEEQVYISDKLHAQGEAAAKAMATAVAAFTRADGRLLSQSARVDSLILNIQHKAEVSAEGSKEDRLRNSLSNEMLKLKERQEALQAAAAAKREQESAYRSQLAQLKHDFVQMEEARVASTKELLVKWVNASSKWATAGQRHITLLQRQLERIEKTRLFHRHCSGSGSGSGSSGSGSSSSGGSSGGSIGSSAAVDGGSSDSISGGSGSGSGDVGDGVSLHGDDGSLLDAYDSTDPHGSALPTARMGKQPNNRWFNAFAGRIFTDVCASDVLKKRWSDKLSRVLNKRRYSTALDSFHLSDLQISGPPPRFDNLQFVPSSAADGGDPSTDIALRADMHFSGVASLTASTRIFLNWPRDRYASLPVQVSVRLIELDAVIMYGANSRNTWFAFEGEPFCKFEVDSSVGTTKRLRNLRKVGDFILSKIGKAIRKRMVFPSKRPMRLWWIPRKPAKPAPTAPSAAAAAAGSEPVDGSSAMPPPPPPKPDSTSSTSSSSSSSSSSKTDGVPPPPSTAKPAEGGGTPSPVKRKRRMSISDWMSSHGFHLGRAGRRASSAVLSPPTTPTKTAAPAATAAAIASPLPPPQAAVDAVAAKRTPSPPAVSAPRGRRRSMSAEGLALGSSFLATLRGKPAAEEAETSAAHVIVTHPFRHGRYHAGRPLRVNWLCADGDAKTPLAVQLKHGEKCKQLGTVSSSGQFLSLPPQLAVGRGYTLQLVAQSSTRTVWTSEPFAIIRKATAMDVLGELQPPVSLRVKALGKRPRLRRRGSVDGSSSSSSASSLPLFTAAELAAMDAEAAIASFARRSRSLDGAGIVIEEDEDDSSDDDDEDEHDEHAHLPSLPLRSLPVKVKPVAAPSDVDMAAIVQEESDSDGGGSESDDSSDSPPQPPPPPPQLVAATSRRLPDGMEKRTASGVELLLGELQQGMRGTLRCLGKLRWVCLRGSALLLYQGRENPEEEVNEPKLRVTLRGCRCQPQPDGTSFLLKQAGKSKGDVFRAASADIAQQWIFSVQRAILDVSTPRPPPPSALRAASAAPTASASTSWAAAAAAAADGSPVPSESGLIDVGESAVDVVEEEEEEEDGEQRDEPVGKEEEEEKEETAAAAAGEAGEEEKEETRVVKKEDDDRRDDEEGEEAPPPPPPPSSPSRRMRSVTRIRKMFGLK